MPGRLQFSAARFQMKEQFVAQLRFETAATYKEPYSLEPLASEHAGTSHRAHHQLNAFHQFFEFSGFLLKLLTSGAGKPVKARFAIVL